MKKITALLVILCLLLCACSAGDDGVSSAPSVESAPALSAAEEPSSKIEQSLEPEPVSPEESRFVKPVLSEPEPVEESEVSVYPVGEASRFEDDGKLVYCAFGDSIAAGYGLNDPKRKCYGALFAAMNKGCEFRNYAVSGHTTGDMLGVLGRVDISDADLVTVSIGANNILRPAYSGLVSLAAEIDSGILTEYAKTLVGKGDKERVDAFFEKLKRTFDETELRRKLDEGLSVAKKELPQLLDKLKELAPHAEIIIQTVYNPYKDITISFPGIFELDLGGITGEYVVKLNTLISRAAGVCECELLDVYSEFDSSVKRLVNASADPNMSISELDPHPNAEGHAVIARLLNAKWKELHSKANEEN